MPIQFYKMFKTTLVNPTENGKEKNMVNWVRVKIILKNVLTNFAIYLPSEIPRDIKELNCRPLLPFWVHMDPCILFFLDPLRFPLKLLRW